MQYRLTIQVSRYCLLSLQSRLHERIKFIEHDCVVIIIFTATVTNANVQIQPCCWRISCEQRQTLKLRNICCAKHLVFLLDFWSVI